MEAHDWTLFDNYTKKYYKEQFYQKLTTFKPNRSNLNKIWSHIKTLLITVRKKTVPIKSFSPFSSTHDFKQVLPSHQALSQLNQIMLKFRSKFIRTKLWPDPPTWHHHLFTISNIIWDHHLSPVNFSHILNEQNVKLIQTLLKQLYNSLYKRVDLEIYYQEQ